MGTYERLYMNLTFNINVNMLLSNV